MPEFTQPDTDKHSETQGAPEEGNTNSPPPTRASYKGRCWCFTLFNYTIEDITFFQDTLDTDKYVFQEEVCPTTQRPHLQGVIYFANGRNFSQMKQLHSKAHWKPAKWLDCSVKYCKMFSKRNGQVYAKGFTVKKSLKLIEESQFYPYQKDILHICSQIPDDRSIYWFWEPTGNVGKTSLIKYLLNRFNNTAYYISGGKASDICSQINDFNNDIELFLVNFPRTSEGFTSYNGIEQVKDGLTSSSKYHGGFKLFNPPHVFIFANFPPDLSALSPDRWKVFEINENKELVPYSPYNDEY